MRKPNGYWDIKENAFEEARKYQTKKEFRKGCGSAYIIAWRNGWLDEMNWFVDSRVRLFTDKIDCVYRYFFKETNSIYIGRTINKNKRDNQHKGYKEDTLYRYAKENGLELPQMEIIEDNLTIEEGQKREDYWINFYKNIGYIILNKAKAGSIGAIANGKWYKETVFEESKKYTSRNDFKKNSNGAYVVALKNGWLDEMIWFIDGRKPNGYWTRERVFAEAKKYQTKNAFKKGCNTAYLYAIRNGWHSEMDWFTRPIVHNKKWTMEKVFEEAKKYKTRSEFNKNCPGAYKVAMVNRLLDELFPKKCAA